MSSSPGQAFVDRVVTSIFELNHQGLRVQAVHISPITAVNLMKEASTPFYGMSHPPGKNLTMSTPIGVIDVEVEPEMADDIFVLGLA